ncbi:sugar ABC transporter permease [Microbacterium sp. NPDC019599]|uniref:carbohydrate ABC transporter permease n=1 Tax=Microbacterium sp. NPDC019599 TaxID=3154690 RepID=UPI0033F2A1A8
MTALRDRGIPTYTRRQRARGVGAANRGAAWMLMPALIFFIAFAIVPLLVALWLSFARWDALREPVWVGADNWLEVLSDPTTADALLLSLKVVVLSWLVQTPVSVLLGTWTAGRQRNRAVLAAIFVLPLILSSAAVAIAFKAILDPNFGLGASLGIPLLEQDWLGNEQLALITVIFVMAWQFVPFHTLLYQGAVRGIPASLYEAAQLDGAGRVSQFFHVTIPQLRYTIAASSTLIAVGTLTYFDAIFVLSAGIPNAGVRILPILMFVTGFSAHQFGKASVIAMILVVIGLAIGVLITKLSGFDRMESQQEGL